MHKPLTQPINADGLVAKAMVDYAERGHQIIQHGFDHRCAFSGNTGREFSTTQSLTMMSQPERIAKILQGRRILENTLGRPVTGYCGPGSDDEDLLPKDAQLLREVGFTWLKDAPGEHPVLHATGGGSYPVMPDFAWGLTRENFDERFAQMQEYCRKTIAEGDTCCLKFHDPFTRAGYEDGIGLEFLDKALGWLESQPDWEIQYATLDEYYAEHGTGKLSD